MTWEGIAPRLEGQLVVVEPLVPAHEDGLWEAASDPSVWRWMPVNAIESRETFTAWFSEALEKTAAGLDQAFAVLDSSSGAPLGSTRYLALRPEHRGLEIGWTWLSSSAWGTGANVDARYYCPHHPASVVPGLSTPCACRKPGTALAREAAARLALALSRSWVVGDHWRDIQMGHGVGARSVLLRTGHGRDQEAARVDGQRVEAICDNLMAAAAYILGEQGPRFAG